MIDIDTKKIEKCGLDLIKLSQDLFSVCNSMYDRINNMPTMTGEWVGQAALEFSKKANIDKVQVVDLKNKLYSFGNELIKYAGDYESVVKKIKQ